MNGNTKKLPYAVFFFIAAVFLISRIPYTRAQSAEDLKSQIEAKNSEIKKLEEEAAQFRKEAEAHAGKGVTLKEELTRITKTIDKLRSDILLTNRKISKAELEIDDIAAEIKRREFEIRKLRGGLATLLQVFIEQKQEPLLYTLMRHSLLSDFFREVDDTEMTEKGILTSLDTIHKLRAELEEEKHAQEKKRGELADLKVNLQGQNQSQQALKGEKNDLLRETQNQEKKYRELMLDREKKQTALESEIRDLEIKLQVTIDPSSLPPKGSGIFRYPMKNLALTPCASMNRATGGNCVTQFFGYTSFAAIGAYNGKGHNGMDFRADVGTPVYSVESGVITAIGDTDVGCRGASYGKWILVKHPNNLSTLYAHLSSIGVRAGEQVGGGQVIGYSGASGYATGPHLHLATFATKAVQVQSIRSRVCGRMMTLPISPLNGYLNPIDYL